MRKVMWYIFLLPALVVLIIGLILTGLVLSAAGGAKGVSVLARAMRAFADNLKV